MTIGYHQRSWLTVDLSGKVALFGLQTYFSQKSVELEFHLEHPLVNMTILSMSHDRIGFYAMLGKTIQENL